MEPRSTDPLGNNDMPIIRRTMEDDKFRSAKRSERVKSIFDSDDSDDEDLNGFHFNKEEPATSKESSDVVFNYDKKEDSLSAEILDTQSASSSHSALSEEIPLQDPAFGFHQKDFDHDDEQDYNSFQSKGVKTALSTDVEAELKESSSSVSSAEDSNIEKQVLFPTVKPQGSVKQAATSYEDDLNVSSDNDDAEDSISRSSHQEYIKSREVNETENLVDAFDHIKGITQKNFDPKETAFNSGLESRLNVDLLVSSDDDDDEVRRINSNLPETKNVEFSSQDVSSNPEKEPESYFQDDVSDRKSEPDAKDEDESSDSDRNFQEYVQKGIGLDNKSELDDDADHEREEQQNLRSPFQSIDDIREPTSPDSTVDKGNEDTFFMERNNKDLMKEDLDSSGQSSSSSYEGEVKDSEEEDEREEFVRRESPIEPDQKASLKDDLSPRLQHSFRVSEFEDESNSAKFSFGTKGSEETCEDGAKRNEALEKFADEADQFLKDDPTEDISTSDQNLQDREEIIKDDFEDKKKLECSLKSSRDSSPEPKMSQPFKDGVEDSYLEDDHSSEEKMDENVADTKDSEFFEKSTDEVEIEDSSMECDSTLHDSTHESQTVDFEVSKSLETTEQPENNVRSIKIKIKNNKVVDDFRDNLPETPEEFHEEPKSQNYDDINVDKSARVPVDPVTHLERFEGESLTHSHSIDSDSGLEDNYNSARLPSTEQSRALESGESSQRAMEAPDGSVTLPLSFPLTDSPPHSVPQEKKTKIRVEDIFTDSEVEEIVPDEVEQVNRKKTELHPTDKFEASFAKKNIKKPVSTSINMPAIMVAFSKGWVRELVFRATSKMNKADVYYRSPSGKKLRSKVEIEDYLNKNNITDLTLHNFTFFKEALGVDSAYEKIRHAGPSRNGSPPLKETAGAKPNANKRIFADLLPEQQIAMAPPTKKSKVEKVIKPKEPQKAKSKIAPKKQLGNASRSAVYATQLFTCNPPLMQPKIITPLISKEMREKTFLCTANCDAGGGRVPNLQCVKCLCLFHSDCCLMPPATVNIILASMAKFLCPNCYREESEVSSIGETLKTPTCYEPLSYDPPEDSEDEGLCSDIDDTPYREIYLRPKTPPPPIQFNPRFESPQPKQVAPSIPVQISQQYQNQGTTNTISPAPNYLTTPVGEQFPKIIQAQAAGTQQQYYLIYNQSGQPPILLPTTMVPNLKPNAQQILPPIAPVDGNKSSIPPNLLLPNTFANASQPLAGVASTSSIFSTATPKTTEQVIPPGPKVIPAARGGVHFLEDTAKVYHLMKRIFSYLSVPDLLVVSRVCVMWKDLALNPCYWRAVRLRNVCVKDWDKLVQFLDSRGTQEIDLRKMVIYDGLHDPSEKESEVEVERPVEESKTPKQGEEEEGEELKEEPPNQDREDGEEKEATKPLDEPKAESKPKEVPHEEESENLSQGKDGGESKMEREQEMEVPVSDPNEDQYQRPQEDISPPQSPPLAPPQERLNQVEESPLVKDLLREEGSEIMTEEVDLESAINICIPSSEEVNVPNSELDAKAGPNLSSKEDSHPCASEKDDSSDPVPIPQTPEEIERYERFLCTQRMALSVLSEHDYFGKSMTESSSNSSSESSSDSSTSESESESSERGVRLLPLQEPEAKDPDDCLTDEMVAVMNMDIPKAEYDPDSYEEEAPQDPPSVPIPKKRKGIKILPQSTKFKKARTSESSSSAKDVSPPILNVTPGKSSEGQPRLVSPKDDLEVHPLKQKEKTKVQSTEASVDSQPPSSPPPSPPPPPPPQPAVHSEKETPQKSDPAPKDKKTPPIIKMPSQPQELPIQKPRPIQHQEKMPKKNDGNKAWHIIGSSLKKLQSLRKLVVGTCDPDIIEIIVYYCHQLTSLTALGLNSRSGLEVASLDPSFLMHSRQLQELRLASQKNFNLLSNFNFIKLPNLKILMLKGLKTSNVGWPYLGTNLTHLYLSCVNTFSLNNWKNISSMSNLITLELEGGGADHDADLSTSLSSLQKLTYLSLFDWHIGPKLPNALRRLHSIRHLHIIPAVENQNLKGVYAGRLLVMMETMKQYLTEFVWGILPLSIVMDGDLDKIYLLTMKANKDSTAAEDEPKLLSLENLGSYIKRKVPSLRVEIKKVSEATWTWCTNEEWR